MDYIDNIELITRLVKSGFFGIVGIFFIGLAIWIKKNEDRWNFKNIGMLMNMKNIYFVPFYQDDPVKKPNSLIGKLSMIPETIEEALKGKQLQPVLCDK